jgi:hypothetical protein
MESRILARHVLRTVSMVAAIGALAAMEVPAEAQAVPAPARDPSWVLPRTPEGHPDLQGNWTNATVTPLERPAGAAPTLTWEDVARIEAAREARRERINQPSDPDRPAPPVGGDGSTGAAGGVGGYNSVYIESGDRVVVVNGEPRTSIVVDPPDGQIPELTGAARARVAEARRFAARFGAYDNPENRPIAERCILSFGSNAGPPMLPNGFYNNNYTIVQTTDHVVILTEMIHDARIIRLGDGPRLPADVRPYFGDSWGRWEGDTLVIETTNFHPEQQFRGIPSDDLKVIERLTRVDEETLEYRFTVEDPTTYVRTWSGELSFWKLEGQVYEYACHEGNYSLSNILSGARYQERQAAENPSDPR